MTEWGNFDIIHHYWISIPDSTLQPRFIRTSDFIQKNLQLKPFLVRRNYIIWELNLTLKWTNFKSRLAGKYYFNRLFLKYYKLFDSLYHAVWPYSDPSHSSQIHPFFLLPQLPVFPLYFLRPLVQHVYPKYIGCRSLPWKMVNLSGASNLDYPLQQLSLPKAPQLGWASCISPHSMLEFCLACICTCLLHVS